MTDKVRDSSDGFLLSGHWEIRRFTAQTGVRGDLAATASAKSSASRPNVGNWSVRAALAFDTHT